MIEQCYEKLAYLLYYDLLKLFVEISILFDLQIWNSQCTRKLRRRLMNM